MAITSITSSYGVDLQNYPLTSQIGEIVAVDTGTAAYANMLIAYNETTIFSNRLYFNNGKVTISEVGSILEEHMRANNLSTASYTFRVNEKPITIKPVYCSYFAPDINLTNSFLSTLKAQRVYPDSRFYISALSNDNPVLIHCVYERIDGTIGTKTLESNVSMVENSQFTGTFSSILAQIKLADSSAVSIMVVTFLNGNASKTYYMMPGKPDARFLYRNCFNCPESLDIKGTITEKTDVSRQLAVCANHALQYDRKTTVSYEFNSEPLTFQESQSIAQLIASHAIYLCDSGDPSKATEILITEHSCEIDNKDDSLSTVKFTYRFAENHPRFSDAIVKQLLSHGGIFTEQFTEEYL